MKRISFLRKNYICRNFFHLIKYLKHTDIDKEQWDRTIEHSFNGNIYAYSWYLDLVCPDWDALAEDDYRIVMPLTHRKKWGIHYLFQPSFTQQLGIFSTDLLDRTKIAAFLSSIPSRYKLTEINLNKFNNTDLIDPKFVANQVTHELDLIQPYENLYKSYSENTKRNIKKAESSGVFIRTGVPVHEIIKLFRENSEKKYHQPSENHYKILIRLVNELVSKDQAVTFGAYSSFNHLCAGAVFIVSHSKIIFIFSGLDEVGRENGAMSLLIDQFIRGASNSPITLDFEGSNNQGLARFYKSFGSTVVYYPQYRQNHIPLLIRPIFKIYKFAKFLKFKNS